MNANFKFVVIFALLFSNSKLIAQNYIRNISHTLSSAETASGKYGVFLKDSIINFPNQFLSRPFIIIEGIDPASLQGLSTNYEMINSGPGVLDKLRCEGYDIVILDINTNTLEIEKNAELVIELIKEINAQVKANGSTHQLKVMGVSMGGLIAKLALRGMEMQGIPHLTETYLSFDVPHRGANVPLGYLHFVDMFLGNEIAMHEVFNNLPPKMREKHPLTSISNMLANFTQFSLTQPAALQMISNYVRPNFKRQDFAVLSDLVGYPQQCRLVGIANGSNGTSQTNLNKSSDLFRWNNGFCLIDRDVPIRVITGIPFRQSVKITFCPFRAEARIWAMPGQVSTQALGPLAVGTQLSSISFGTQLGIGDHNKSTFEKKRMISRVPGAEYNYDFINNSISDMNRDHVPGGYFQLSPLKSIADKVNNAPPIEIPIKYEIDENVRVPKPCGWWLVGVPCSKIVNVRITLIDQTFRINKPFGTVSGANENFEFSFIPTTSALDIRSENYFYDFNKLGTYPNNKSKTPFDAIYWNTVNSYHANFPSSSEGGTEMDRFITEEVAPYILYLQNRTFPIGYTNTFEAKGRISVGKNVDPVPGRSQIGNVTCSNNNDLKFIVGNDARSYVTFEDGFDSGNANIEVSNRPYAICSATPFRTSQTRTRKASNEVGEQAEPTQLKEKELEYDVENFEIAAPKEEIDLLSTESDEKFSSLLFEAVPNPLTNYTRLNVFLEQQGMVSISIFNSLGNEVVLLESGIQLSTGSHSFDFHTSNLPSGIYHAKANINGVHKVIKLVIEK